MRLTTRTKIRLARLAQGPLLLLRRLVGRGPVAAVRRNGVNWRLDLREGIDFSVWLLGRFEPGTTTALARLVGPGSVVLDIGANMGAHTLPLAARVGPAGRIHAFEPTDGAMARLRANIEANGKDFTDRIIVSQVMLAGRPDAGLPDTLCSSWPLAGAPDADDIHGGVPVSTAGAGVTTLDDWAREVAPARVDLVKIDVDGHECEVLRGGLDMLRRYRPPIVIELAPAVLADHGTGLEALLELLCGAAGYTLFDENGTAPLPDDPAILRGMIPEGGSINVLARPR